MIWEREGVRKGEEEGARLRVSYIICNFAVLPRDGGGRAAASSSLLDGGGRNACCAAPRKPLRLADADNPD